MLGRWNGFGLLVTREGSGNEREENGRKDEWGWRAWAWRAWE